MSYFREEKKDYYNEIEGYIKKWSIKLAKKYGKDNAMLNTNYIYEVNDSIYFKLIKNRLDYFSKESRFILIYEKDFLWMVPISEDTIKYRKEIRKKIKLFGACQTILIKKIAKKDYAILLQQAFPILERFVKKEPYKENNKYLRVPIKVRREVMIAFTYLLLLRKRGNNLFFTNIDYLKNLLISCK